MRINNKQKHKSTKIFLSENHIDRLSLTTLKYIQLVNDIQAFTWFTEYHNILDVGMMFTRIMKLIMTIKNYSLKSSSMFCFYDDLSTAGLSRIVNERCWIHGISQPIPYSDPMVKLTTVFRSTSSKQHYVKMTNYGNIGSHTWT